MEIRKIALSLVAAMALGTTAVQAQCTDNCKKNTTTKVKNGTTVNRFEKDLKRDEAKVKTVAHKAGCAFKRDAKKVGAAVKRDEAKVKTAAHKAGCAFKRDAKKVGAAVKRDEAKVKTAAHKAGCAFKRDAKKVGAAVKRDEMKVGKAVKKTYTKAKNALKK
mgnify:FL=1